MKSKFMLFTIFMLSLTFYGESYTVISSKTEVSPGCGGRIEEYELGYSSIEEFINSEGDNNLNVNDLDKASDLEGLIENNSSVATKAKAFSVIGSKGTNIPLNSKHSYFLKNNSNESQSFKIEIKLLAHDGQCNSNEKIVRLKPKEVVQNEVFNFFTKTYALSGTYPIHAITNISLSASSSNKDTGVVTIN